MVASNRGDLLICVGLKPNDVLGKATADRVNSAIDTTHVLPSIRGGPREVLDIGGEGSPISERTYDGPSGWAPRSTA